MMEVYTQGPFSYVRTVGSLLPLSTLGLEIIYGYYIFANFAVHT